MAVQKISISLDSAAAERARRAAKRAGVSLSAWLSDAAMEKAAEAEQLAEARAALDAFIATYGEPDADTVRAAEAELAAVGFWEPETVEHAAMRREALARLFDESTEPRRRAAG